MANLSLDDVLGKMVTAAAGAVGQKWPQVRSQVESELRQLAEVAVDIAARKAQGKIDQHQAETLFKMQANALTGVLAGLAGQARLTAEMAINAAVGAAKDAVRTATGFPFI
ncbi:MAG TPA: hypothetical protein VN240_05530 [Propylenella sp.]|nr:hypothetical protein [Propylenella sp.]